MIELELRRVPVLGDDAAWLIAREIRFETTEMTPNGPRLRIGARKWLLSDGQALHPLSDDSFLATESGEVLTRR